MARLVEVDGVGAVFARFGILYCGPGVATGRKVLRLGGCGGAAFRRRQNWSASSSFFLASHLCCIKVKAEPKIPSGTICMSSISSLSLSERLVRFSHRAHSCSTIEPSAFPEAWTGQRLITDR